MEYDYDDVIYNASVEKYFLGATITEDELEKLQNKTAPVLESEDDTYMDYIYTLPFIVEHKFFFPRSLIIFIKTIDPPIRSTIIQLTPTDIEASTEEDETQLQLVKQTDVFGELCFPLQYNKNKLYVLNPTTSTDITLSAGVLSDELLFTELNKDQHLLPLLL